MHIEQKELVRLVKLCAFLEPLKEIPEAKQEATEGTVGSPNLGQIL